MKIVINTCYGGFWLSEEAMRKYCERKGVEKIYVWEIERDDPDLVAVVEELGVSANGRFADLEIVEVPDSVVWEIGEYDGKEWVAEVHRKWG